MKPSYRGIQYESTPAIQPTTEGKKLAITVAQSYENGYYSVEHLRRLTQPAVIQA
jgi:hypothetical protein